MRIGKDQVVTIEYTLRDGAGQVLESSQKQGPITFVLGSDRMLPGLAKAIEGMRVNERRVGTIAPGELVPLEVTQGRRVPYAEFPGERPVLGDRFQAKNEDGSVVQFQVTEANDDAVVVHLLHPLFDTEVHYEVTVLAARRMSVPPPPPVDVPDMTDDLLED